MKTITQLSRMMFAALSLMLLLAGCGGGSSSELAPLSADNLNLIFVVSPDLDYPASGDVNKDTANLSNQGLQRSLMMATYLKQHLMGGNNVNGIHALTPMTHLQTANKYPDMAALGYIQQFALLNQITLGTNTANSYPLNAAYVSGAVPDGVAMPKIEPLKGSPSDYCPDCSGLVFNDTNDNNAALVSSIIKKPNASGFYVFSAPWQTISALMANIKKSQGYELNLPAAYMGPNHVYAISIAPSGGAKLVTYDSKLNPPATYPVLPSPVTSAACTNTQQDLFSTARTGGVDGAKVPANSSTNQTIYIVRHAEAHPDLAMKFENGNFVGAGQWRALDLPNALRDKISRPDMVYSIDPAQWYPISATQNASYVRPSLTVLPYVIANDLPYYLVSSFSLFDPNKAQLTSDFFFTGDKFSNKTVLVAWESGRIRPLLNALINSYGGSSLSPLTPTTWPGADYDTIWTVKLDAKGNLTVDNKLCEGIDTAKLPVTAPQF